MTNTLLAIDIGSTSITAVIAKNNVDGQINILGTGTQRSEGIEKGLISNIEIASKAIKNAVVKAKSGTSEIIDSTIVSVSGAYAKEIRSSGSVNVPTGLITESEINQVMQMAVYMATKVPEYQVLHVLPIGFKVDDSEYIDNPLNMNGGRLEVSVYIVTVKKTVLTNIKSALKASNLEVNNFVLNGYASSLSVLDEEQKKFGIGVIDIGGSCSDIVCYKGKSIIYNNYIPVGSSHITNDLSVTLHTPVNAAEKLKEEYGTLIPYNEDTKIKKVKMPILGDEQKAKEITLDYVQSIIHARVEELLILTRDKIKKSGVENSIGAGIVITGGMSKLPGIKELATKVFDGIPVKIAKPSNNGLLFFNDSQMATIMGLIMYGLDNNPSFELDSNENLRKKKKVNEFRENISNIPHISAAKEVEEDTIPQTTKSDSVAVQNQENKDDPISVPTISKTDKKKGLSNIWNKVSEWF